MSENIITTAAFGQTNDGDKEEEPIIVAQRFLNIFRQLHIFSAERKEAFNQMLLEQPNSVLVMLKTLPGGSVLLDYLKELDPENSSDNIKSDDASVSNKQHSNGEVLKTAITQNDAQPASTADVKREIINSDDFAKILASSLAQSNAQIIRELQNSRPAVDEMTANREPNNGSPLKLVADETFTKTIATALADALSASEEKRQADNKLITQSFLELQENLNKMVEQNNQLKIISNSDAPAEAASAFQLKNVVDDLVRAQSKFLRETTQSQKEELSSIISVAIKESLKLSTQSLIDSFKQIDGDGPTPITYAASSTKKSSFSNVEEAIKAQGREFSSIISTALRESQQNSAQTIIKTLEGLKDSGIGGATSASNIEDIMKMQADLFRDITQAQNREFSHLISTALKESQKQSTDAIIAALSQLRPVAAVTSEALAPQEDYAEDVEKPSSALILKKIISPQKDYLLNREEAKEEEISESKKKKKKKKKKQNQSDGVDMPENIETDIPIVAQPLHNTQTIISALPDMPIVEDTPSDDAFNWGLGVDSIFKKTDDIVSSSLPDNVKDDEVESDWTYQTTSDGELADNINGTEGQDWEWEYEEVPYSDDAEGTEGQDWEWEYEEVPENEAVQEFGAESDLTGTSALQNISNASEIILPSDFEILLIGMESDAFRDPYLENSYNMG